MVTVSSLEMTIPPFDSTPVEDLNKLNKELRRFLNSPDASTNCITQKALARTLLEQALERLALEPPKLKFCGSCKKDKPTDQFLPKKSDTPKKERSTHTAESFLSVPSLSFIQSFIRLLLDTSNLNIVHTNLLTAARTPLPPRNHPEHCCTASLLNSRTPLSTTPCPVGALRPR